MFIFNEKSNFHWEEWKNTQVNKNERTTQQKGAMLDEWAPILII